MSRQPYSLHAAASGAATPRLNRTADPRGVGSVSTEANKDLVRRLFDLVNANDPDGMVELVTDDFVVHTSIPNIAPGRAGFRAFMDVYYGAFPEQNVVVNQMIGEGDRVVVHHTHHLTQNGPFAGLPPTGKQAVIDGIEIFRVAGGKIAEMWHQDDLLSLLQQLGAIPAPGQRAAP
jgi:steroid delta-isomerase-like uncharacterized protein